MGLWKGELPAWCEKDLRIGKEECLIMKEKEQKKITKKERIQMKQRLTRWGGAIDYCHKKQQEIEKLQRMTNQFLIWGENAPFLGQENVSIKEAKILYEFEVAKAMECIKSEMKQNSEMERYIEKLKYEEQVFLKLRYEKGYGYDYIALQTHKSRATCFRDHDLILDKLILFCGESEKKETVVILC